MPIEYPTKQLRGVIIKPGIVRMSRWFPCVVEIDVVYLHPENYKWLMKVISTQNKIGVETYPYVRTDRESGETLFALYRQYLKSDPPEIMIENDRENIRHADLSEVNYTLTPCDEVREKWKPKRGEVNADQK